MLEVYWLRTLIVKDTLTIKVCAKVYLSHKLNSMYSLYSALQPV